MIVLFYLLYAFEAVEVRRSILPSYFSSRSHLILITVMIGLIGPVMEEIGFRLFIGSKKKLQIFSSIIILSVYIFLQYGIPITIIVVFLVILSVALYLKDLRYSLDFQIIITSIIFTSLHFDEDTFTAGLLSSIAYFSYFIGSAFIFAWLRINYSIFSSIFLHVALNAFVVIVMIFDGFESTTKTFDCSEFQITYNTKNIFKHKTQKTTFISDTLVIQNSNLIYMLDLYMPSENVKTKYQQNNPFVLYDLKIPNYYERSSKDILECLEENQLIFEKNQKLMKNELSREAEPSGY